MAEVEQVRLAAILILIVGQFAVASGAAAPWFRQYVERHHAQRSKIMTESQRTDFPAFTEHRVQRDRGSLYIRDFPGSGPAFVLLHGFPDNSHIL
ncbi:MAG: hypothetical protein WCD20_07495 [Rhodomicrobium sp.]